MKKLSMEWTNGIKDEAKRIDFENAIRNSTVLVRRQVEILKQWEAELLTKETSDDYSSPSWALKQADHIGQRKIIKKLLTLLSFTEQGN
jgi:hypothetical protein